MIAQTMKQSFDVFAEATPTAFVEADHDKIFIDAPIDPTSTFGQQLLMLGWNWDTEGWVHYV